MSNNSYTFDVATLLKDAGLVAGTGAAATVSGSAAVVDLGQAFVEGVVVCDVSAIEVATDELYTFIVQGAATAAFSTPVPLASLSIGHSSVVPAGSPSATTGRFFVRFQNEQNGTIYRYIRLYTLISGTIATGINYVAWIGKTGADS